MPEQRISSGMLLSKPLAIISDKVLLVEGQYEVYFFEELHKHLGLTSIQILNVEGKNNFANVLPIFLKHPDFKQVAAYAIIRDADDSRTTTFSSIKGLLQSHGQPCPRTWSDFASADSHKVGVFIMPGNAEVGMLESLCLQAVADHPIMFCVDDFMRCLREKLPANAVDDPKDRARAFYPKNVDKARVQAF